MKLTLSADTKKDITGWLFILPQLLCFLAFIIYPILTAVKTSFYGFDYTKYYWAELDNYIEIFRDKVFIKSIYNTLLFVVIIVPLGLVSSLSISMLINRWSSKTQSVFKAIFYIPGVTSVVSLTLIWQYLLNEQFGLVNYILKLIGIQNVNWFGMGYNYLSLSLIMLSLSMGANIVILTAGLNGIPVEMYEAAYLDGAKGKKVFLHITLPLLKPTLLYIIVTSTIGAFQIFVIILLLTGGGPAYSTTTILMLIYREAFMNMNIGKACSMGIILCMIISLIAVFQFKFMSSDVEY